VDDEVIADADPPLIDSSDDLPRGRRSRSRQPEVGLDLLPGDRRLAHGLHLGAPCRRGASVSHVLDQDKRHVTNYAQWRTQQDLDGMMRDETAGRHMAQAASIATSFDPIYYKLRQTMTAE